MSICKYIYSATQVFNDLAKFCNPVVLNYYIYTMKIKKFLGSIYEIMLYYNFSLNEEIFNVQFNIKITK